jgi:hypothetical protein
MLTGRVNSLILSAFDLATNISYNPKLDQMGIAVLKKGVLAQAKNGD